jgi:hypothetical protein
LGLTKRQFNELRSDTDFGLSLAVMRSPLLVSSQELRLGQWQVGLLKKLHKGIGEYFRSIKLSDDTDEQ